MNVYLSSLEDRLKQALVRVRAGMPRALIITFSSMFSYWLCETILHHKNPVYCVTVCVLALGFRKGARLPIVIDVVLGSTFGIMIAELMIIMYGSGIWQAGIVLFFCMLIGRFLNEGLTFHNQIGLQSVLVMLYPTNSNGPFSRPMDAMVGGIVAIIVTIVLAANPRNVASEKIGQIIDEMSNILKHIQYALRANDEKMANNTLHRARETQSATDDMFDNITKSFESAKLSPQYRSYLPTLERIEYCAYGLDFAMRNTRIISRLSLRAIRSEDKPEEEEFKHIAYLLDPALQGLELIRAGVASLQKGATDGTKLSEARSVLTYGITNLGHLNFTLEHSESHGLLLIIRELYFDLLRATGMPVKEVYNIMPDLDI